MSELLDVAMTYWFFTVPLVYVSIGSIGYFFVGSKFGGSDHW